MNRRHILALGISAVALLAIPVATVLAEVPPGPPSTLYYGKVTGGVAGQGVVAIVIDGSRSTVCGATTIQTDATEGAVYAIDIISDSQTSGCGLSGRQVKFYLTPTPGTAGRLANETVTIPSGYSHPRADLTLGAPLSNLRSAPLVASDKVNY